MKGASENTPVLQRVAKKRQMLKEGDSLPES